METRSFWAKDPFLLMRLYTDLVMNGMKANMGWNNGPWMPFCENYTSRDTIIVCHLHVAETDGMEFHNHGLASIPTELTAKNYLSILKSIQ